MEMTRAQLLIKKCKEDIIDHIKYEMGLINTAVNISDKDGIHTEEEDWTYNPIVKVEVEDPYTMDRYEEERVVTSMTIEDDGDISVGFYAGDEISIKAISVEGLQYISDCLEESYKHLISE